MNEYCCRHFSSIEYQDRAGGNEHRDGESSSEPRDGESSNELQDGESSVEPRDGESSVEPRDWESSDELHDGESSVEPRHGESSVEPRDGESSDELRADSRGSSDVTNMIDVRQIRSKMHSKVVDKIVRKLRVASWNFSGLCSERKQNEVAEVLKRNNIDVVAGQESWEKEDSRISVDGYKWFGKPRLVQGSQRGEGGVGFLVKDCLVSGVEFIKDVKYEQSVWMRVKGERGRSTLFLGCIYMPTDSVAVSVVDASYDNLKEDVLAFREKGQVVLLGDFNARVGKSYDLDDVIGIFGEDTSNSSGNRLISFLNEVELVICNGREFTLEPQWTRVRPSMDQMSIIDYIITDSALMQASGSVQVDNTDIGTSDHVLVWIELGRTARFVKKQKRRIRKWRVERLKEEEVRQKYQEALEDEVKDFEERIQVKKSSGLKGHELVDEVVKDWEDIITRVAKKEIGEKMIVCGQAARWWDEEIKEKIRVRREVYRQLQSGNKDKWDEYCKLRAEVKELVRKKKLQVWDEVIEKVNKDYDEGKKEFWAFVGRRTKSKRKNIASLRSDSGVSVTSTKGKLNILQKHYEKLGSMSVDDDFDDDWKEWVENKVHCFSGLSSLNVDDGLDKEVDSAEIKYCIRKLKNNKTGGNDGFVGEMFKYGGYGMVELLKLLFEVVWTEECVPRQWRQGLIVNLFKKGDSEDPGNYRGITLLSVVGKVFCKVLNNRLMTRLEGKRALHEGQAGFRIKRSCVDNIFTLNEIIQGRLREGKKTFAFFLDIQKAYDTVWRDGLWFKLWDMGVRGRMWRVIKEMYKVTQSAVFLEGEKSSMFNVQQGVAQGCSLSPILFSI